jgi:hypothetical protein
MEIANEPYQILKTTDADFIRIIGRLHKSLENGMRSAKTELAKKWLQERRLTYEATGACYNSGQIHHHKQQPFKNDLMKIGFLKISNAATNAGQIPYTAFGRLSVIFPLRNMDNQAINFYAIGVQNNKTMFLNDDGIYPRYPGYYTERLFIVTSILDAATILQSGALKGNEAVISMFDGQFKAQHYEVISALKGLKEIKVIENKKVSNTNPDL